MVGILFNLHRQFVDIILASQSIIALLLFGKNSSELEDAKQGAAMEHQTNDTDSNDEPQCRIHQRVGLHGGEGNYCVQ